MTEHQLERPLERLRAAVAVGPLFEETEALYPYYRLQEAGAAVAYIGTEAQQTVSGKQGYALQTERAAADLGADDLDLLVIAGGYGPDKLRMDEGCCVSCAPCTSSASRSPSSATPDGCRPRPGSWTADASRPIPRSPMICATPARSGRTQKWSWTET